MTTIPQPFSKVMYNGQQHEVVSVDAEAIEWGGKEVQLRQKRGEMTFWVRLSEVELIEEDEDFSSASDL